MASIFILLLLSKAFCQTIHPISQASRTKIAIAQICVISSAIASYQMTIGIFPTTEQGLQALYEKPIIPPIPQNWDGPYMEREPIDPWGKPYQYRYPSIHGKKFDLWSFGPDGKDGTDDDITNWAKAPQQKESFPSSTTLAIIIYLITAFAIIVAIVFLLKARKCNTPPG